MSKSRPLLNYSEIPPTGILAELWFLLQDLEKSSPKLLNRFLRYCMQIVLRYLFLKFVRMVATPTLLAK